MYFQDLSIMKNYQIDDYLIKKLDVWMGTRRRATWRFLNPIQFSIDCSIDLDTALMMFSLCTTKEFKLLKQKYEVECYCGSQLGVYDKPSDIPLEFYCFDCSKNINIEKDLITIWFELIKEPTSGHPYLQDKTLMNELVGTSGKASSLRPQIIEQSHNHMARRLLTGLDERLRNSS